MKANSLLVLLSNWFTPFCFSFFLIMVSIGVQAQDLDHRHESGSDNHTVHFNEMETRARMKKNGLTEPVISGLIEEIKKARKSGRAMHYQGNVVPVSKGAAAPCSDLGVENGWASWSGADGFNDVTNDNITWGGISSPPGTSMLGITSGGAYDPDAPMPGGAGIPIPVVCPFPGFGNNSIIMNPGCVPNNMCQLLTYPITVSAADTNFVYAYAVVLEDGGAGHGPLEQPFVEFVILDAQNNIVPCTQQRYVGGPNVPGFYSGTGTGCSLPGAGYYKPWTIVGVDLSNYVGQTLTVVIKNVDCVYGGHYVKSYWDFLCGSATLNAGCVGSTSQFCGPQDPGINYSYQWFRNNTAIPAPQGIQACLSVIPNAGDTFRLSVSLAGGACGFSLLYVPEVNQPSITSTVQCYSVNFNGLSINGANSTVTGWNWSFPGGTPSTSTQQSPTVAYPGPGNYSATLNVEYSVGCSKDVTQQITISSPLTPSISTSDGCEGTSITLYDQTVSLPGDPITSWSWSFPAASPSSATVRNPQTTFPAGNHPVQLIVQTATGCRDTATANVQVYRKPFADFSTPPVGCVPLCHTFSDNSTSADGVINTWNWSFNGGNPANSSKSSIATCWNNSGNFDVRLIVSTQYGCKDTLLRPSAISALPVPAATIVGTTRVCQNGEPPVVNLFGSGSVAPYTIDYLLNGAPQQGVTDQSGLLQVTVPTDNPGLNTYTLQAVTSSGTPACSSQTGNQKVEVIVDPLPIPEFQAAPKDCPSSPSVYFYNESQFGSTYRWEFGDGGFSDEQSPTHYYHFGGDYTIRLVAISPFGCVDSISKDIQVEQDFRIWYPNAFTPNEDDLNENFYPIYISASQIDFAVFNRWGKEVFRSRELSKGWNGRFEGAPAPEGAYVFTVKATDLCGEQISYTGKFFLIR